MQVCIIYHHLCLFFCLYFGFESEFQRRMEGYCRCTEEYNNLSHSSWESVTFPCATAS